MHGFAPFAINRNIVPGGNDPSIVPCGVVLHVRDGLGDSLHDQFDGPSGGIESHFYIRFDGTIEQYRSIFFEADAQLDGNSFDLDGVRVGFVSVETEGLAKGQWTAAQISSIKEIILWVRTQRPFPLRVCPAWNAPGVGYHTLFGSPSHWTPVAKSCPGDDRKLQFRELLVPWMEEGDDPMLDPEVKARFDALTQKLDDVEKKLDLAELRDRRRAKRLWRTLKRIRGLVTPTP